MSFEEPDIPQLVRLDSPQTRELFADAARSASVDRFFARVNAHYDELAAGPGDDATGKAVALLQCGTLLFDRGGIDDVLRTYRTWCALGFLDPRTVSIRYLCAGESELDAFLSELMLVVGDAFRIPDQLRQFASNLSQSADSAIQKIADRIEHCAQNGARFVTSESYDSATVGRQMVTSATEIVSSTAVTTDYIDQFRSDSFDFKASLLVDQFRKMFQLSEVEYQFAKQLPDNVISHFSKRESALRTDTESFDLPKLVARWVSAWSDKHLKSTEPIRRYVLAQLLFLLVSLIAQAEVEAIESASRSRKLLAPSGRRSPRVGIVRSEAEAEETTSKSDSAGSSAETQTVAEADHSEELEDICIAISEILRFDVSFSELCSIPMSSKFVERCRANVQELYRYNKSQLEMGFLAQKAQLVVPRMDFHFQIQMAIDEFQNKRKSAGFRPWKK